MAAAAAAAAAIAGALSPALVEAVEQMKAAAGRDPAAIAAASAALYGALAKLGEMQQEGSVQAELRHMAVRAQTHLFESASPGDAPTHAKRPRLATSEADEEDDGGDEDVGAEKNEVMVAAAAAASAAAHPSTTRTVSDVDINTMLPAHTPLLTADLTAAVWRARCSQTRLATQVALIDATTRQKKKAGDGHTTQGLLLALLDSVTTALGMSGQWVSGVPLVTCFDVGPELTATAVATADFAYLPPPHGAASIITVSSSIAVSRNEATCVVEGLGAAVQQCAIRMFFMWLARRGEPGVNWWTYGAASDGFFLWLVKLSIVERVAVGPQLVLEVSTRLSLWPEGLCAASLFGAASRDASDTAGVAASGAPVRVSGVKREPRYRYATRAITTAATAATTAAPLSAAARRAAAQAAAGAKAVRTAATAATAAATRAATDAGAGAAAAMPPLPAGLLVLIALMTADREALGSVPVVPPGRSLAFRKPPASLRGKLGAKNPNSWKGSFTLPVAAGGWSNIGSGRFSDVYAARHGKVDAVVKRYRHPDHTRNASLLREACACSQLAGDGAAPRLLGGIWQHVGVEDKPLLTTLLLAPRGVPLTVKLARMADDDSRESVLARWKVAVRATHAVLGALASAHAKDIFHNDVRPANVIVLLDGGADGGGDGVGAAGGAGGGGGGAARGAGGVGEAYKYGYALLVDWGNAWFSRPTATDELQVTDVTKAVQLVHAAFEHIPPDVQFSWLRDADEAAATEANKFFAAAAKLGESAAEVQAALVPLLQRLTALAPAA